MTWFVDTNVFIRLLTRDDAMKAEQCLSLFQRATRGEITLFTSESIVAEITFVLSSRATYHLPRELIATALRPVLAIPGLRISHKESVLRALDQWEVSNLDYEDCMAIEHIRREHLDGLYSYDQGFDRVSEIRRLEP